ncbi:MAG TPA: 4-(cytidine 5'-diphospho)-2-C-methyl-D-erythritol kinase [Chitinophagaceae bacterium]
MVLFPNCKINVGLNIIRKRIDGYHDLETVFYPTKRTDALEIIEADRSNDEVQFTSSGLDIEVSLQNNLCFKAYQLIKKDFPDLPSVKMHLHKKVPIGAGLGGGSSDGAFTLKLLNQKFNLGLSTEKLLDYAIQLGSDCPFFIINKPCFAQGRGEKLESINLDLSSYQILITNPQDVQINTAWAFSKIIPSLPAKPIKEIIQQPVEMWRDELKNDFEEVVFERYPNIRKIKENFYNAGAIYSSMSGSGSSIFAIFNKEAKIELE